MDEYAYEHEGASTGTCAVLHISTPNIHTIEVENARFASTEAKPGKTLLLSKGKASVEVKYPVCRESVLDGCALSFFCRHDEVIRYSDHKVMTRIVATTLCGRDDVR